MEPPLPSPPLSLPQVLAPVSNASQHVSSSLSRCLRGLRHKWPSECHPALQQRARAESSLFLPPGEDVRKTGWSCHVRDLNESLGFPPWLRQEQCGRRSGMAPWVSEICSSFATWACRGHSTKLLLYASHRRPSEPSQREAQLLMGSAIYRSWNYRPTRHRPATRHGPATLQGTLPTPSSN